MTRAVKNEKSPPRLKHLLSKIYAGGTPESGNEDYWSDDESGVAWIAIGDMSSHELVCDTQKRITSKGLSSRRLEILPKGTLIYSMYASVGLVAELGIPATINQAILGFQYGFTRFRRPFGLYVLVFIEQVEAFQQFNGRHAVTSCSSRTISASASFSSASISSSGRGGVKR